MRIGIFTDTYRPSVNGIVYVTEILRRNFEALGHEVYIFAPGDGIMVKKQPDDPHLIRFPAVQRIPSEEMSASFFYPPMVLKQIEQLNLDILHFLTPGTVGLMGVYAGHKLNKPVVAEYCTDLFEYADRYPLAVPATIVMGLVMPFAFKATTDELRDMLRAWRPRRKIGDWSREMVKNNMTVLHEQLDTVIVHSRKSEQQLKSWQNGDYQYDMQIIPTGVDALPVPAKDEVESFKNRWSIDPEDEPVLFIGRLGPEKNLDMLIDMINELVKWRPNAKLLFVGDSDYRKELQEKAAATPAASHIVFTGKLPREKLPIAHAAAKVFVFPSMTDTQALVIHEAARSGLPVVMVDKLVTEVVHDGENGFFCENDPIDMADKVRKILEDSALCAKMSKASKKFAAEFSELGQAKKIVELYESIIRSHSALVEASEDAR